MYESRLIYQEVLHTLFEAKSSITMISHKKNIFGTLIWARQIRKKKQKKKTTFFVFLVETTSVELKLDSKFCQEKHALQHGKKIIRVF